MTYNPTAITKELRIPQTDERFTMERTCETCSRNQNGKCLATNMHIFDSRELPVKYGGCGELVKWRAK